MFSVNVFLDFDTECINFISGIRVNFLIEIKFFSYPSFFLDLIESFNGLIEETFYCIDGSFLSFGWNFKFKCRDSDGALFTLNDLPIKLLRIDNIESVFNSIISYLSSKLHFRILIAAMFACK
jgi:hypothetical protein